MRSRTVAVLSTLTLLPLAACFAGPTTTDELRYQIDQPVTALVIDARAAGVAIATGDGLVTVTEEHRYSSGKPARAYQVQGQTLRLTESGWGTTMCVARSVTRSGCPRPCRSTSAPRPAR